MKRKFLLFLILAVVGSILFPSTSIVLTPRSFGIYTLSPFLFSFSGESIGIGYGWERKYDVFRESIVKLVPFKKKVKLKISHVETIAGGGVDLVGGNVWLLFGLEQDFFTPVLGGQKMFFLVSGKDSMLLNDLVLRIPLGNISLGYKSLGMAASAHMYFDTVAFLNYYGHVFRSRIFPEGFYLGYRLVEEGKLGEYGLFAGVGYMDGPSLFFDLDYFERLRFSGMVAFSFKTGKFYPVFLLEERGNSRLFLRMHENGALLYIDLAG